MRNGAIWMEWLNYHHLLYFWTVAKEGSIARATGRLNLTQPAISKQIKSLEESLGEPLFLRTGRGLVLTETGKVVCKYADEIFSLGREMLDTLKDRPTGRPARVAIGVADFVPKLVAYRLLRPAFDMKGDVEIVCREDSPSNLFAALALHELDLVISDAPLTSGVKIKAFNHLLGESTVSFFATPRVAEKYSKGFPASLDGAPMLLPIEWSESRRALQQWFDSTGIRPRVVGDFQDGALAKVFAGAGVGIVTAPTVIAKEIRQQYGLETIGRIRDLRDRFYAVSPERKITNPAVAVIMAAAKGKVFRE